MRFWKIFICVYLCAASWAICSGESESFSKTLKLYRARRATSKAEDSECSSIGLECSCKKKRHKEQSLTCMKENCIERLPTSRISSGQAANVVSLLVARQKDLTSIGENDLRRLGNVRQVRLFRCRISSIAAGAFVGLNHVERLDLHRNRLAEVPSAIKYLRGLKSLNLGGNQISFIEADAFRSNTQLEKLVLSRNSFSIVPRFLPPSLVKLSVSVNKLRSVGDLSSYTQLTSLHADRNSITEFPRLPASIRTVNMCGNQLRRQITLRNMPNLTSISISDNPYVGDITVSTFSELAPRSASPRLKTFLARNAGIRSAGANAFACLPRLRNVDISHNDIRNYQPMWFAGNRGLRSVQVTGNPWSCQCDIRGSLYQIASKYSTRRTRKSAHSNSILRRRHRKPDDGNFVHDFDKEECSPTTGNRMPSRNCGKFKVIPHSCSKRDSEIWHVQLESLPELTTKPAAPELVRTREPTTTQRYTTTTRATTTHKPVHRRTTTTERTPPSVTTTHSTTTTARKTTTEPVTTTTRATTTRERTRAPENTPSRTTRQTTTTRRTTTPRTTEPTTTTPRTEPTTTTPRTTSRTTTATPITTTRKVVMPPIERPKTTKPTTTTTTTKATTTTTVATTETTTKKAELCLDDGRKCHFPFMYKGTEYNTCTGLGWWCSATYDYDSDGDWDYCKEC